MATIPGQDREYRMLPATERPIVRRKAARIIVRCQDRVFLEHDSDPGAGVTWWMTPGGGLDGDETYAQAAVRELFEETGWTITEADLVGPVAHRYVSHGYSDEVLTQDEQFFVLHLSELLDADTSGFTEEELRTMHGSGWFTVAELSAMQVFPADIARFLGDELPPFVEYGNVDESIVPLDERFD
ncbi:MAG: NUDIX domain-containing protein [Propionibacteriaceae bacterium]|jgi:8-oxo-dGTP pyrophosphatase MutT (NUDIX family)|nr:NUDIX domain-containing protein [Propionibacteriaceae bacterium]